MDGTLIPFEDTLDVLGRDRVFTYFDEGSGNLHVSHCVYHMHHTTKLGHLETAHMKHSTYVQYTLFF